MQAALSPSQAATGMQWMAYIAEKDDGFLDSNEVRFMHREYQDMKRQFFGSDEYAYERELDNMVDSRTLARIRRGW